MHYIRKTLGEIFLSYVCSYDGSTLLNCIESYDPHMETWQLLDANMASHRCDAGVAVVRRG